MGENVLKRARKRPKFGLKVAEISEILEHFARNFEKTFWQHCFVDKNSVKTNKNKSILYIDLTEK